MRFYLSSWFQIYSNHIFYIYLLTEEPVGLSACDMEGLLASTFIALHTRPRRGLRLLPALLAQVTYLNAKVQVRSRVGKQLD